MRKFTDTQKLVYAMLTENTGSHICDSGGAYRQPEFNTYNGDSDLSQILQGAWLEDADGDTYLLLQIHGGCDARGGYTDAKLFKPQDEGLIHSYLQEYIYSDEIEEEYELYHNEIK